MQALYIVMIVAGALAGFIGTAVFIALIGKVRKAERPIAVRVIGLIVGDVVCAAVIVFGILGVLSVRDTYVQDARTAAATLGLHLSNISWGSGVTIVGNGCTVPGDVRDGLIVLRDTNPSVVVSTDLVKQICAAQTIPS